MNLILFDRSKELCSEFEKAFTNLSNVTILHTDFHNLPECDCIVSPANSFGIMDGGIDLVFTNYFGTQLMGRVQKHIINNYAGEQPVGTSFIIETFDNSNKYPYLAHTPTMTLPMDISDTNNVYYAMKAMLLAVSKYEKNKYKSSYEIGQHTHDLPAIEQVYHSHPSSLDNKIQSVACCGLGTATGRVPFDVAAKQMALAYEHFLNPTEKIDWKFANNRYGEIERIVKI